MAHAFKEHDGVIRFTVTSNGRTGPEWIREFHRTGVRIGEYARRILASPEFEPTNGVTYEVEVLKGVRWGDKNRSTARIRKEAIDLGLIRPHLEVMCLVRTAFSERDVKDMGLYWMVGMHGPVDVGLPKGSPSHLLSVGWNDDGYLLETYLGGRARLWDRAYGFAFVRSS